MTLPKQNGREEAGACVAFSFPKWFSAQSREQKTTNSADPKDHTLFSALSGLRMGHSSIVGGSLEWNEAAVLAAIIVKTLLKRILLVAVLGAGCGFAFGFLQVFVLGPWLSSGREQQGGMRAFFEWLNRPLGYLQDWLTRNDLVAADNMFVGLLFYFLYWMTLGAVVALVIDFIRRRSRERNT